MQLPAQLLLVYILQILLHLPWTHPALDGAHSRWESGQGVTLCTHLHPVPKIRTRGAIPPTATRLHIEIHNSELRVTNFRLRDPLLWSFEGADSSLPASDVVSLVEWLQKFGRNVVCLPSKAKQPKGDSWKWRCCDLSKRQESLAQWHDCHIVEGVNLSKRRCVKRKSRTAGHGSYWHCTNQLGPETEKLCKPDVGHSNPEYR